jgi:hypothetical protein
VSDLAAQVTPVRSAHAWPTNGYLIADVARLGYLRRDDRVLDPTFGLGVWWDRWRPDRLTAHDLDPAKAPDGAHDFRALPYPRAAFDAVAFDPPYKLNGTPDEATDGRYGVDAPATVAERMGLILEGMTEAARVLVRRGVLLVKCQDQVVSGAIYWQTDELTAHAAMLGFVKVDRFDLLGGGRPQPGGRAQQHAYGRPSTLLVFVGKRDRPMGQRTLW